MDNFNNLTQPHNNAMQQPQQSIAQIPAPQQQTSIPQISTPATCSAFNPLKSHFDIELHKLRKQSALYFRWGPNYERQGLILELRNIMTALSKEYIRYKKSKSKNRLYEIDALIELLRVLWFDYYELGYLKKPLKSGKQESIARAIKRYDIVSTQINKLGAILGVYIKNLKQ